MIKFKALPWYRADRHTPPAVQESFVLPLGVELPDSGSASRRVDVVTIPPTVVTIANAETQIDQE
eukprot:9310994-Lingulodinium_polyedra.AAC.1